jgi:hypothetical protein
MRQLEELVQQYDRGGRADNGGSHDEYNRGSDHHNVR